MTNQMTGMEAERGYSYADLEEIAHDVRRQLQMDPVAAVDMQQFFEFRLDDVCVSFGGQRIPFVHGVAELTTEALTRWDPDSMRIEMLLSGQSYEQLCSGYPRPKYAVAHELGHGVLHTGKLIKLAEMNVQSQAAMHRGRTEHPPYMDTEWQANAFAGAFLVPARGIKALGRTVTATQLAFQYDVSVQAAAYRLDTYKRGKTGVR